jgi:general secretion pathway protein J
VNAVPERMGGFTLLEMTVVLMLVALISVVIVEALRFGMRAYAQVARVDAASWDVFIAQRFLRRAIESAFPFEPDRAGGAAFGLEGTATHLSFSAPALRSGPGGFNRYEVHLTTGAEGGRNLLVSWRVDRHERPEANAAVGGQETLLENVMSIEWSYRPASCAEPAEWQQSWQGRRELPALVRARVVFAEGDPRQWPDLIIAPRITDDAISWFYRPPGADSPCAKPA